MRGNNRPGRRSAARRGATAPRQRKQTLRTRLRRVLWRFGFETREERLRREQREMHERERASLERGRTSWDVWEIDERLISRYRFERTPPARLRAGLDGFAFAYLLAAATVIARTAQTWPRSPLEALTLVRTGFTLEPPLPGWSVLGVPGGLLLLLALAAGALVYQSSWLKRRIHATLIGPHRSRFFHDFNLMGPDETTLTSGQRVWTAVSWAADDLFTVGVVASLYRYLLDVRMLPFAADPAIRSSVVFAGMLLTVIGAYDLIEALQGRLEGMRLAWRVVRAAAAIVLSGAAFALVFGVGLRSGTTQIEIGACFGTALALGTALRTFGVLGHPERPLPARIQGVLRRTLLPPLTALGKLLDGPLRFALQVGVAPLVGAAAVLRFLLLGVWYALTPIIAPFCRLLFGHSWRVVTWQLQQGLEKFQHGLGRRVEGALLHGLLKGNGWLPRMIKRDPVRYESYQLPGRVRGGIYVYTDPLEPEARPRYGGALDQQRLDLLYWRLLDLMLATFVVAYVAEVVVGHAITFLGRPLLHLGFGFAIGYGLVVGFVYMLLSTLGRSSVGGLAVGLVSGLSLAPAVGLAGSLALRLGHDAVPLLLAFLLAAVTSTLGRRGLVVAGVLALLAGVYLMRV